MMKRLLWSGNLNTKIAQYDLMPVVLRPVVGVDRVISLSPISGIGYGV